MKIKVKNKKLGGKFLALCLIYCLSSNVIGCSSDTTTITAEKMPTPVETTIIANSRIAKEVVYAGQVQPIETLSVVSKTTGKVENIYYDVGDKVEKGAILFSLDEKDIRDQIRTLTAQLNQSLQGVESAENALSTVTGGQFESQLLQQQSGVDTSQKQLESAQANIDNSLISIQTAEISLENAQNQLNNITTTYENSQKLYAAGTISKTDYDNAKSSYDQAVIAVKQSENQLAQAELSYEQTLQNYETARISLNQAEESLRITNEQIKEENIRSAELSVDSAKIGADVVQLSLDMAYETLSDLTVESDISGIVSVKNAKAGEYVTSSSPAYVIINTEKVNVNVNVSELIINLINPGDEVNVTVTSLGSQPILGTIKTVAPAVDNTGTFPVTIEIDNSDGLLKSGMFAQVNFVREESNDTIVLPINSVLSNFEDDYVFINDNGLAKKVSVTTGINDGQFIEITSGLSAGNEVVTTGHTFISHDEEINVVNTEGE